MSETVINVENLSKRYIIGRAQEGGYKTLRDALAGAAKRAGKRLLRPLNGSAGSPNGHGEEFWALKDVSFAIKRGEVVGIIGRNGAGKSTLLKILSRITEPTAGRVRIKGRVASLLEVGTGFHPELTGRENIFLNGAILGMSKAEIRRKFDEIVAFAEVERFLDTPVKRYSSGMYVRLAFAVAAHLQPDILIVDEVLAVGDTAFQKKCIGKMGKVAKEGRTVLFVSHNLTAIRSLCQKAILLDKATMVSAGEVGRIVNDYLQTGTASVLQQEWGDPATAPGNEKVRIRSARIVSLAEDVIAEVTVETPLQMDFEFWNYVPDAVLNLTLHLFTIEGTYVFAVGSTARKRQQGLIKESVKIPPHLLNDGIYSVTIQVVDNASSTAYLHPDILVFEVRDSVRVGNWFGKWPGVIRPRLEWLSPDVLESGGAHERS